MLLEILNIPWLGEDKVFRDFKQNMIRQRYVLRGFKNKSWLEKEYVNRDFKDNLIREIICNIDFENNLIRQKTCY